MRSIFANLRTLVLPAGATSGVRLLLDGSATGPRIVAFDAANNVIGRMQPNALGDMFVGSLHPSGARAELVAAGGLATLLLGPPDWPTHTLVDGQLQADVDTTGLGQAFLLAVSPTLDGGDELRMFLIGESGAGTQPRVLIDGENQDADLVLNLRSMPRGILAGAQFVDASTSDSARAAGAATDMSVTMPLVGGRTYLVVPHTQVVLGTANVDYGFELEHDGTVVGRFRRIGSSESGDTIAMLTEPCTYVPAANDASATLTLANASTSAGTITCQVATGRPRILTVFDLGRL